MANFIGLEIPPDVQKKWEAAIKKLGEDAKKAAAEVIQDTTTDLRTRVVKKTPVVTGRLQQSITQEVNKSDLEGKVFTNVEYAPNVEYSFCKKHQIKHLMFTRSMEEIKPKFLKRLERAYEELMR